MTQNTNVKIDRFDFIEIKFSYLLKDTTDNQKTSEGLGQDIGNSENQQRISM